VRSHEVFPGSTLTRRFRRRQLLRRPRRPAWLNATAVVSILALLGIALVGALLNRAGGGGDAAALVGYARRAAIAPAQLIVAGARTHRILVLGDAPGSGAAKRMAAAVVTGMALGPGLDVLVLDVDSALQPSIDAYLEAPQEDVGILLSHPGAVPEPNADDYLGIYRTVWALNQRLGADRAISILADGMPGWPPVRALAPGTEAELFARLGPAMARRIEDGIFARNPGARVLAFVGGYQALKSGYGALSAGGGAPVNARWLAAVLDATHPGDVFSVIQDGPPGGLRPGVFTSYTGTLAYQIFRDGSKLAAPFGLTVGDAFRFLRQPITTTTSPGLQLSIEPTNYQLGDVVDGYIYLGPH
jgi:hypothetical protein